MNISWLIIPAVLAGIALYGLLPALICALSRKMANASLVALAPETRSARLRRNEAESTERQADELMKETSLSPLFRQYKRFHSKLKQRLHRAGYDSPHAVWIYLASQILLPPLLLLLVTAREAATRGGSFSPSMVSAAAAVLPAVLVNGRITSRIAERKKAFTRSLYKIYRFLDLQLSAGIKMTDALSGLPGTVTDPLVHPVWLRFSALYELTLDLDAASDLVRQAFGGSDCEMLATHLRQCMQTGQAGRSLKRMEELLFSRFFSQMQQETKQIRTQLLVTACLGLVPAIVTFLYPMIHEATNALQSIFG